MLYTDIFDTRRVFQQVQLKKRITVSGLAGSSYALFSLHVARHVPQLLLLARDDTIEDYYYELKRFQPDIVLTNSDHPFYLKSHIIMCTKDFLACEVLEKNIVTVRAHQTIDVETLTQRLQLSGYTREDIVEEEGEYALRGGILDIFAPDNQPVRIELSGDEICSLRIFNTQNQRSVEELDDVTFALAIDAVRKPLLSLLDTRTLAVSEEDIELPFPRIIIGVDGEIDYKLTPALKYFGDIRKLKEDIMQGAHTFRFFIPNRTIGEKLRSLLGDIEVYEIPLEHGFVDEKEKIIYLTESEIFGTVRQQKRTYRGLFVDDLLGLQEGDYVVHSDYGIGQFKELTLIDFENRKVECLRLDYAGGDKVYLPVERMNLLERYVATSDAPPRLSKLGSELWLRTKNKVKKATERLALDLLTLYTRRSQETAFQFSRDAMEMKELESSFPFEETPDQLKAINDVKRDMESPKPAERLICGDVGYGKTEIALRAAFKAALDGKQTMILCPTTLLAFQHYTTFKKRLESFPVTVEMISRFRKKEELKKTLHDLASGAVDIVIGTHRLLQPDVHFKDLGILIIDEEQRFGVIQKEKIKNLKPGLHTFYLSATPIPRTLYMGLTGLKHISNIYTPPPGRKDISTKVIYYDDEEIKKIVAYECARGGQIFFVHNRVQTIESVRARLHSLIPDVKICVLHGQMREDTTAKRMVAFLEGKFDMLLSTAIVESGLDMPHVNTILVDQAHTFGLADLHQLRGRIGRSTVQGHAYFIVPSHHRITDEAHKRLGALVSYASLGSGFRLALRDMEIRGVGNLLGKEQSGHINAIGYHLYLKILSEAVTSLRGTTVAYEPILDLKIDAYFPSTYIEKPYERTALYKRLLAAESSVELDSLHKEIVDRFGQYPEEVNNLFLLSEIRLRARDLGASEVVRKGSMCVYFKEGKEIHRHACTVGT